MKKIIIFVLLGLGVVALNTNKVTSTMTQLFAAKPAPTNADERLQTRLAMLDELREMKKRVAPEKTFDLETYELAQNESAETSGATPLKKILHPAIRSEQVAKRATEQPSETAGSMVAAASPQSEPVHIKIMSKREALQLMTQKQPVGDAPIDDKSIHASQQVATLTPVKIAESGPKKAPVSEVSLTESTPEKMAAKPMEGAPDSKKAEVQVVATAQAESSDAYVHVASMNIAEQEAPVLEFQWSKQENRLIPVNASADGKVAASRGVAAAAANDKVVEVQPGDSLTKIAKRVYGDANKYIALFAANRDTVKNVEYIYPGQKLKVPDVAAIDREMLARNNPAKELNDPVAQLMMTVTVEEGDTLSKIAGRYLGDIKAYKKLFEINRAQLTDPNIIYPGQKIRVPVAG